MINSLTSGLISITLCAMFLSCGSEEKEAGSGGIEYWTAPSIELSRFEKEVVDKWTSTHKETPIDWKTIPAGITSEEVILTAIATRTGPDVISNIFGGFAAQLADAGVIVALDTLPGFWDVVEKRKMANIVRNDWFYKGHIYVIPMYTNPEMVWYNKEMLDKFGITELPRTYSEFFRLLEMVCIPNKVYGLTADVSSRWYSRWFDYLTLYASASGGVPYIDVDKNEVYLDSNYGIAVTEFFFKLFDEGYAPRFEIQDGFEKGVFFASIKGAGSTVRIKKLYPDLKYEIGSILVPDDYPEDAPVYTLAESKGMVLFESSNNKDKAWDFMKWYFSGEHDSLWIALTNYLPAREDLTSNPIFTSYFDDNPTAKIYADILEFTVPLVLTAKTVEIQTILNRELWQPIIFGTKSPVQASQDANMAVQRILKSGPPILN
ncbi:MAG: extracellular solute-binding protein [Candidatus Marinimicrobia bacterium]|nr:extracellular solute-binding protein [Candidatus Neomarinimicrobiota bacterium]